jgi:hypothetical protein
VSALVLEQVEDCMWELSFCGELVGWIRKFKNDSRNMWIYQVETPRGEIRHCYLLSQARNTLLELYA